MTKATNFFCLSLALFVAFSRFLFFICFSSSASAEAVIKRFFRFPGFFQLLVLFCCCFRSFLLLFESNCCPLILLSMLMRTSAVFSDLLISLAFRVDFFSEMYFQKFSSFPLIPATINSLCTFLTASNPVNSCHYITFGLMMQY